jgi:sporulation protein YtfJ
MANENKLQDIIQTSLENIRSMVDANTVIGNPINTESGTTIIPISKISMGFASGGMDFSGKIAEAKENHSNHGKNFGGGGGTGLSISPVGFLIVGKDGKVEMLNTGVAESKDLLEQIANLLERSPDIVEKFKTVFQKKSAAEKAAEADE